MALYITHAFVVKLGWPFHARKRSIELSYMNAWDKIPVLYASLLSVLFSLPLRFQHSRNASIYAV